MEAALKRQFNLYDLDGSGEVDSTELGKILEALGEDNSEERVKAAIAEVDLNANGKISFDEFVKFVELTRAGDKKATGSDFAAINSLASAKQAILEKIKDNTPEKIKKERVWTPGVDKEGHGKKASQQTAVRREPPKGAPPPRKSLTDLP